MIFLPDNIEFNLQQLRKDLHALEAKSGFKFDDEQRIANYIDTCEKYDVAAKAKDEKTLSSFDDETERHRLVESKAHLTDLHLIVKAVLEINDDSQLKEATRRLKLMDSGERSLAEELDTNQSARDFEFELVVYATFKRAGLKAELAIGSHPDLNITGLSGRTYRVECKRCNSASSFKRNLWKALDQLEEYSLKTIDDFGLVVISCDAIAINPSQIVVSKTQAQAQQVTQQIIRDIVAAGGIDVFSTKLKQMNNVLGILCFLSFPIQVDGQFGQDTEIAHHESPRTIELRIFKDELLGPLATLSSKGIKTT